MPRLFVITVLVLLTGCQSMVEGTSRALKSANREMVITKHRIKGYFHLKPYTEPVATAIPSSYCYKVLQDVVCYRDPQPGMDERLVGYQEPSVITGDKRIKHPEYQVTESERSADRFVVETYPLHPVEQEYLSKTAVSVADASPAAGPSTATGVAKQPIGFSPDTNEDPYAPKPLMPRR